MTNVTTTQDKLVCQKSIKKMTLRKIANKISIWELTFFGLDKITPK